MKRILAVVMLVLVLVLFTFTTVACATECAHTSTTYTMERNLKARDIELTTLCSECNTILGQERYVHIDNMWGLGFLLIIGVVLYYIYKTYKSSKEYVTKVDATVSEMKHSKDQFLVTVRFNNVTQTFNDKNLFYHSKPGDVIPVWLYQKYNHKHKLICQELRIFCM